MRPDSAKKPSINSKKETQIQILEERHPQISSGSRPAANPSLASTLPVRQENDLLVNHLTILATFAHSEYQSNKVVPFTTIKQLGHGSLGSVDAGRRKGDETGPLLARKVIDLPNTARKRLLPLIQQEVAVLRRLKHKHIVQVVSTYETTSVPRQFGIIILPAGDEDLGHYLERVRENEFLEASLGYGTGPSVLPPLWLTSTHRISDTKISSLATSSARTTRYC